MNAFVERALGAAVGERRQDRESERAAYLQGRVVQPGGEAGLRGSVPVTAAIVTGTNESPSPTPASSDGPSTSAR